MKNKMKALYLKDGQLEYRDDYPQPVPQEDEALVRVRLAGICSTDLELVKGYAGGFAGVLGHEFVGEVVSAEDSAWVGKRVVASINMGCGTCEVCHQHGPEHCPRRVVTGIHSRDGVFAEYVTFPTHNLFIVPDNVPDEAAVFTEPLAAAVRIREQIKVRPEAKTAVIGPGRLGILVGQVLLLAGTEVMMIGRNLSSLTLPQQLGLATGMTSYFADNSFNLVVETTGNEAGFAEALRLIRPLGTLVLKSTFHGGSRIDLTKLVVGEINVVGSRCGPFAPALRLLSQQQVNVQSLIQGQYKLADGVTAFEHASLPGVRKILLKIA